MKTLLNSKWRIRATSTTVACFCAVIVIAVGTVTVICIVKLCKKMKQREEQQKTNQTEVVSFPMPHEWVLRDAGPQLHVPSSNAMPFVLAIQESADLTNWRTINYMTGLVDSVNVPLYLLDANSNVLRVDHVPLFPSIQPKEPIVREGTNRAFYRMISIE